jgi:hypothetical protein
MSSRTSPMSRNRRSASFSRHRRSTLVSEIADDGSAFQFGSSFRMLASVSETSSPSNARVPVSIS